MKRAWLLLVVATACGGPIKQPDPANNVHGPVQAASESKSESSCPKIARHAVGLIAAEKSNPGDDETAMMTDIVETRCTEDQWTASSKTCMANAAQRADVLKCFEGLTDEQQLALRNDEKTRMPKHIHRGGSSAPPPVPGGGSSVPGSP